jgi:3-oxoacyl-[acyl-carrier-protein] synthase-3
MKIEYYLPETVYTNQDLEKDFPDWTADKIEAKVGIRERHIASVSETALDLAYEASKSVLKDFDREKIDFVLLCTQSPDYFLPTSACILQDRLGLRKSTGALDFNLGCSGFIYGLAMAKGLIKTGIASNVLLVTAETYSKHMHPNDRANRSIFGDGAAATIIESSDVEKIHEFVLGTDGSGMNNLIVPCGGLRQSVRATSEGEVDENGNFYSPNHLYMNGPEIFNFTIANIPAVVDSILEKNNLAMDQVDYFIFHQANKYMLEYLRKKIKIPPEKFYSNMLTTGNTVSATIPIALKECMNQDLIHPGNRIMLVGFGVGYSWGGVMIEVKNEK